MIITIIVLLILAGVTLAIAVGDNGIIAKAQTAKDKTNEAQENEKNQLSDYEKQIDSLGRAGSGYNITKLWEFDANASGASNGKTLGDFIIPYSIDNYDAVKVLCRMSESNIEWNNKTILIFKEDYYAYSTRENEVHTGTMGNRTVNFAFKHVENEPNKTKVSIGYCNNVRLVNLYGINF